MRVKLLLHTIAHMTKKPTRKTAPVSQRMDAQLKADLEALAKSDNRSLTNYIQTILQRHIQDAKKKRSD